MVEAAAQHLPTILQRPTCGSWLPMALDNFDAVLIDHAHCEKKAAAAAMSLVAQYPERQTLVQHCVGLAQEELRHFSRVYRILIGRGLTLTKDHGDPYAQQLRALARHGQTERLVDVLLVCALIEARSCERLALLAGGLQDRQLQRFYEGLARAEAGHHVLFTNLAYDVQPRALVAERLNALAAKEAQIVASMPVSPRIH